SLCPNDGVTAAAACPVRARTAPVINDEPGRSGVTALARRGRSFYEPVTNQRACTAWRGRSTSAGLASSTTTVSLAGAGALAAAGVAGVVAAAGDESQGAGAAEPVAAASVAWLRRGRGLRGGGGTRPAPLPGAGGASARRGRAGGRLRGRADRAGAGRLPGP